MRRSSMPGSAARFLVPFTIAATIASGFALYAWGGMGPSEQELIAAAASRFGPVLQSHASTASLACARAASSVSGTVIAGLPHFSAASLFAAAS